VSQLVIDPERFIEDPMESVGMGVVYMRTAKGEALRDISDMDRSNTYRHLLLPSPRRINMHG
jgi:hypothetical protein